MVMEEKINQFFLKWNGVGCDFDGQFGFQCMDIFEQYNKDIIGGQPVYGNAIDVINKYDKTLYDFMSNNPNNYPTVGDVILWDNGVGVYGHIAICYMADSSHFVSFDQNYPTGSLCHFQSHNYNHVVGWMHPKLLDMEITNSNSTELATKTSDQTKLQTISDGLIEYQAVKSLLEDRKKAMNIAQGQVDTLTKSLNDCENKPAPIPLDIPSYLKTLSFWDRLKLVFS